ncbi:Outer membrane protein MIP precursor [Symmachiella macrocystis]|uniref:Peptidyl-prolyl cis-trans isomerase n=1 Tax=Symmachiella macrocystis TaxID=2527985 RepID=A0A5C6BMS7_9PLAN|nr:FKBP-type peptidyl-prolyl cis-trans isomerase [Symmachiella macrocystis]TWU13460.1 Outer membrane protein MIP precursor [Symmachiella macrocystis]
MSFSFSKMKFPIAMGALLGVGAVAASTGLMQGSLQTARADTAATSAKAPSGESKAGEATNASEAGVDLKALSYIIGTNVAQGMQEQKLPLQADEFIAGFRNAMAGKASKYSDEEMAAVLTAFQKQQMEDLMAEHAKMSEAAKKKGEDFLAKNKSKEGVSETASGLQYRVIEAGDGQKPSESDRVKVHYRGTLMDGKEFDSSYKRGEPVEFNVGGVIPGWTEALQLMSKGAKWELYIPAELAYGPRGAGGAIGPNEVLVFEVELLDVMEQQPSKPLSVNLSEAQSATE